MRRVLSVAAATSICLLAGMPGARAASPAQRSMAGSSCTAKGNVSFMFWGDGSTP